MEKMVFQAEIVGSTRHKRHHVSREIVKYPGISRVGYGITQKAVAQHLPVAHMDDKVHPEDYPKITRGAAQLLDLPSKPTLSTALHQKTVIGGFRMRDSGYRPPKDQGFGSRKEKLAVAKLRELKQPRRDLLNQPVDETQMNLLINTAVHSQELYEKMLVVEKPPSRRADVYIIHHGGNPNVRFDKSGGVRSTTIANQIRKNQARKQLKGTIYL